MGTHVEVGAGGLWVTQELGENVRVLYARACARTKMRQHTVRLSPMISLSSSRDYSQIQMPTASPMSTTLSLANRRKGG